MHTSHSILLSIRQDLLNRKSVRCLLSANFCLELIICKLVLDTEGKSLKPNSALSFFFFFRIFISIIRSSNVCVFFFYSGVSIFAMLTGTLPFTVEPFNIKQLHQKMVVGEISPIPSDISPGNVLNFL